MMVTEQPVFGSRIVFGPMTREAAEGTYHYLFISPCFTNSKFWVSIGKEGIYFTLYDIPLETLESFCDWMTRTGFDWTTFKLVV